MRGPCRELRPLAERLGVEVRGWMALVCGKMFGFGGVKEFGSGAALGLVCESR